LVLLVFQAFHVLLYFRIKGEDWCNEVMNEESDDDEGEDEKDD
jgi:hypothetical protein